MGIVVEIYYLTTATKGYPPQNNFNLTGIIFWCELFGDIVGCFGLWIHSRPSNFKMSTFMVLNLADGCFYLSILVHEIMKSIEINFQRGDHETVLTTMSVIHITIGVSQEAITLELCCFVIFLPKETQCNEDLHSSTPAKKYID